MAHRVLTLGPFLARVGGALPCVDLHMDIKYFQSQTFPKYLPRLNSLYEDLFVHGKGFRAQLVRRLSRHLGLDESQILLLSQTVEFIHNASLLHDDLVDRSHLRRNKPAAWLKYTPEYAVLAGDYLLARVMVNLSHYGNLKLIQLTAETISDLLEGEWIQDSLANNWSVKLSKLDEVHNLKTASLFKWCLRAPFTVIENREPKIHGLLENVGGLLGLLFQRSDDLIDFDIRNFEEKTILSDLKSGYLNSFGAHLLEGLPKEKVEAFSRSQTMEDVFESVGKGFFDSRLEVFDAKNLEYIELYQELLLELAEILPPHSSEACKELKALPQWLYWRREEAQPLGSS